MISFFFIISCQSNTIKKDVLFDNEILNQISINSEKKDIIVSYQYSLVDPYIDHLIEIHPSKRISSWINSNINNFGTMNKLLINIKDASIKRSEIINQIKVAGVLKDNKEYKYEMNIVLQYLLIDDNGNDLVSTDVRVKRTTTSNRYISINESDFILDNLTYESLKDIAKKSEEMLKLHMSEYIL